MTYQRKYFLLSKAIQLGNEFIHGVMIPNSGSIQVLFIQTYSTEHLKFAKLYARHSGTTTIIAAHVSEMIIERDSTLFTLYNRPLYNAYYILITV